MSHYYTGWGYTGYELLIRFSALWILVFLYLCLYSHQILRAISSDLNCVASLRNVLAANLLAMEKGIRVLVCSGLSDSPKVMRARSPSLCFLNL